MKTSISSYSFAAMSEPQINLIEKTKTLGFDAIEFTDIVPLDGKSELETAKILRETADRIGIEISCYSVGADLLAKDIEAEIARIKAKVDVAEALGVKMMRHDATFRAPTGGKGFINVVARIADACREITEYAAAKGIRTMVENHGMFCQDSDRVELLVNTVDHPNFGIQLDVGNFLCVDEDPATAVGRCAGYAFNVHIKDFLYKSGEAGSPGDGWIHTRGGSYIRGTIAGHGIVPIKQCVEAIKRAGYNGYLTLEFEGLEQINIALRLGYEYMKKLV